jgi:drug/metabolite transporter (DMT)-like permease
MVHLAESIALTAPFVGPKLFVAYIDPGTGSMIFQLALAALLSIGVAWRQLRARIGLMFAKKEKLDSAPTPTDPPAER